VVTKGILIAPLTSLVVRITMATTVVLSSSTVAMGAIGSNSLIEHLHQISGLIHDRSDASYAIFFVTQRNNVHS
jgi:hypothetical protein